MTSAEQKAKELVDKYMPLVYVPWHGGENEATQEDCAKEAAIIAVDEILKVTYIYNDTQVEYTFWSEVKEEIIKL